MPVRLSTSVCRLRKLPAPLSHITATTLPLDHPPVHPPQSLHGENGVIVDPLGRTLAESSHYGRIIFSKINLDSRVVHIDYNADRVRRLKEKYGPQVKVETASPEAVYLLSSLNPGKSIRAMIEEFEIETLDAYLDRARSARLQYLPKTD